jgi:hypothetical protein
MPDKKYHGAIVEVLDHVKSLIKDGAKVLEIGPGHVPFSKATHFCGWTLEEKSRLQNYKVTNVSVDVLPYSNKEFDFVYCRHVIEDLWNPSHCLNEISRVAKEGWIETPSPLCEMTKNVDGSESVTTPWRGYAHHRYMVWNDNDVLKILPKFPMVDYYTNFHQENMKEALKNPFLWCTYYHFKGEVKYKLLNMGREQDFTFMDSSYHDIILKAIDSSMLNYNIYSKYFEKNVTV